MKKLNFISLLILLICLFHPTTQAQQAASDNFSAWYISVPFEFQQINNSGLNDLLRENNLPDANHASVAPGLEFRSHINRMVMIASFNRSTKRTDLDTESARLTYYSFAVDLGYDFTKSVNYSLYPYLGLKTFSYKYKYSEKTEGKPSLGGYLGNQTNSKELENFRLHLDLGVGASLQPWILSLNVKTGFLIPINRKWKVNDDEYRLEHQNLKAVKTNFYVTVGVGLGSTSEVRKAQYRRKQQYTSY